MNSSQLETRIFKNPDNADLVEAAHHTGTIYKTILDEFGNLYLWDGDLLYHQQVMEQYGIPQELYSTAERFPKDTTGDKQLAEYIQNWRNTIKGKRLVDGTWLD
jgi:hypothetical protein